MSNVTPILRRSKIVGNYFRPAEAKAAFAALKQGDLLTFEMEPTNEYDPFAVKVLTAEGVFVGYVPKEFSGVFYTLAKLVAPADILGLAHGSGVFSIGVNHAD
jgi:hypothetical protein